MFNIDFGKIIFFLGLFIISSIFITSNIDCVALAYDSGAAPASFLDASRYVDWTNAGVPGGIPERINSCLTDECNILYEGLVSATTINAALVSAPDNSVVRIPEGNFVISSNINIYRNNVVLRGAGMGQTRLNLSDGVKIVIGRYAINPASVAIESGLFKGATSFIASSVSNLRPGLLLIVTEDNEPFMWSRWGNLNMLKQVVKIENVNGSEVTFSPPLVYDFFHNPKFGLSQSYWTNDTGRNVGLENLTVHSATTTYTAIEMIATQASWIKDIEIDTFGSQAIMTYQALQNTIQGCYIHGPVEYNEGYGIYLYANSTANVVENNRFKTLWGGVMGNGSVGNVIAYNYSTDNFTESWPYQVAAFNEQHGPHSMFNLWEGNVGQAFQNDGYHGSGSHTTLFRNYFHGVSSLGGTYNHNRIILGLNRFSRYTNVIGNVLGSSSWTPVSYQMTGMPNYTQQPTIYRLGYPNMGNNNYNDTNPPDNADAGGLDLEVQNTLVRHKNFDYFNNAVRLCSEEAEGCQGAVVEFDLPNSLYLTAKPAWWCTESVWPPINSEGATDNLRYSKIPSQIVYEGESCSLFQIRGDVDDSAAITTTDALLTLRNSLGLSMSGTAWRASATTGDVNCDGVSNSTDALLILRHSLGLSMDETNWCE